MATVNLGRIKPVFRGAYAGGTAYVVDDIVTSGNETFICIQASTGNATSNASYWTKLAAKGADGTDVGATLNNKEIAFKTNAGAVDGIPIGTAGQFLKVNSGATGYEYGAVSSDYVKLAKGAITSDTSYLEVNGYFDDSVYHCYKVFIEGIRYQDASGDVNFRWTTSAGTTNSTNDYFIIDGSYYSNGSKGYQNRSSHNNNNINDFEGTWTNKHSSATSNAKDMLEGTIYQPQSGKAQFSYRYNTYHDSGSSGNIVMAISSGLYGTDQATAKTGFQLKKSGGTNIRTANWALYGIKK